MFNPKEHLMNLKGKQYLQVMWRLVWFREERPLWNIDTHLEQLTDTQAVFSAKIYDESGAQKAAGYGSESVKDFKDFIEKAETKAIGRALAMLGYGTQFAPEFDLGEQLVDSPIEPNTPTGVGNAKQEASKRAKLPEFICEECGTMLQPYRDAQGRVTPVTRLATATRARFGKCLCSECSVRAAAN